MIQGKKANLIIIDDIDPNFLSGVDMIISTDDAQDILTVEFKTAIGSHIETLPLISVSKSRRKAQWKSEVPRHLRKK